MHVAYNSEIAILVINSAKGNLSLHMGFIVYNSCTHSSSKLKKKRKRKKLKFSAVDEWTNHDLPMS